MAMFRNGPGSPFPVGTNPVSNATADLNGDGHLDLLTANYISDNASVLFGDGNGGFTAAPPGAGWQRPPANPKRRPRRRRRYRFHNHQLQRQQRLGAAQQRQ